MFGLELLLAAWVIKKVCEDCGVSEEDRKKAELAAGATLVVGRTLVDCARVAAGDLDPLLSAVERVDDVTTLAGMVVHKINQ